MAIFRRDPPEQMAGFTYCTDEVIVADAAQGCGLGRVNELAARHCPDCDFQAVRHVMGS